MGAPTDEDILYYPGADGTPTNDTDPIGGAIDTGTPLDQTDPNLLFDGTPANAEGGADITHRNVAYLKNEEGAGGTCSSGKLYLENGLTLFGSSGTVGLTAGASDAGKKALLTGVSGGAVDQELVTLINGTANSATSWDNGEHLRIELLQSDGVTPTTAAAPITVARGSNLGVIPAGRYQATTEYELAAASAKNTTLSAANRLANPTGITAFSRAIKIDGTDASIATPTPIADGDYFGYVLRKTLPNGFVPPLLGYVDIKVAFEFVAAA